jgi:hypothetical protein
VKACKHSWKTVLSERRTNGEISEETSQRRTKFCSLVVKRPVSKDITVTFNLFLSLMKQHIWRSVNGIDKILDPCIYNLDIRSTSVFSFIPRPFTPEKRTSDTQRKGSLADCRAGLDAIKKKQYVTVARIEPRFAGRPDHCLVVLQIELWAFL